MMQPLALLAYENLIPGGQLVNRLRELGYRILVLPHATNLAEAAREHTPLVILVDLISKSTDVPSCIAALRDSPETDHIPILAFAPLQEPTLHQAARQAGATLTAVSDGILEQLPALMAQALDVH
ncbi:MAG: hypothetical protein RI897_1028 [Verrucomicrobiota bacterium]|jgi:CheY-like chemotaxis protein